MSGPIDNPGQLAFHRARMRKLLALFFLAVFTAITARGGPEPSVQSGATPPVTNNFEAGATEFQSVTGAFFFFDTTQNNRPSVDLTVESLRLGRMLSNPHGPGLVAGNFEFLGEVFAGPIVTGPGNVTAGATLFLRYNFVQPRARIIPYAQIGAGGVYTDISEKESRGLISLPVEFNLQGAIGTRIMLNDRWSIVVETGYRHISNATIKLPNYGIDSLGGNLGFGFFF
ncbi:MAG: acyloxyacyl hydrolase [Chthoniobacterales bacterium]